MEEIRKQIQLCKQDVDLKTIELGKLEKDLVTKEKQHNAYKRFSIRYSWWHSYASDAKTPEAKKSYKEIMDLLDNHSRNHINHVKQNVIDEVVEKIASIKTEIEETTAKFTGLIKTTPPESHNINVFLSDDVLLYIFQILFKWTHDYKPYQPHLVCKRWKTVCSCSGKLRLGCAISTHFNRFDIPAHICTLLKPEKVGASSQIRTFVRNGILYIHNYRNSRIQRLQLEPIKKLSTILLNRILIEGKKGSYYWDNRKLLDINEDGLLLCCVGSKFYWIHSTTRKVTLVTTFKKQPYNLGKITCTHGKNVVAILDDGNVHDLVNDRVIFTHDILKLVYVQYRYNQLCVTTADSVYIFNKSWQLVRTIEKEFPTSDVDRFSLMHNNRFYCQHLGGGCYQLHYFESKQWKKITIPILLPSHYTNIQTTYDTKTNTMVFVDPLDIDRIVLYKL
jgi:hypothetical protein